MYYDYPYQKNFPKMLVFEKFTFSLNFSQQRPLISNFTTMTIVILCCHKFTQSAYIMIFFESSISHRPTDLSLLKEFSKNVSFSNLPSKSAIQKLSMSTTYLSNFYFMKASNYQKVVQERRSAN